MQNNFSSVPDPERVLDEVALPAPRPGVDFSQYQRTDAGNAVAFLDLFGERLRYVDGCWGAWNGEAWVQVVELHLLPLAPQATEEMLKWAARGSWAKACGKLGKSMPPKAKASPGCAR
jgi:hypothetical protein